MVKKGGYNKFDQANLTIIGETIRLFIAFIYLLVDNESLTSIIVHSTPNNKAQVPI